MSLTLYITDTAGYLIVIANDQNLQVLTQTDLENGKRNSTTLQILTKTSSKNGQPANQH
jgi:hypothetical protein